MNKFEKVSFEQFYKDFFETQQCEISREELLEIYNNIKLPQRATEGSAGYDFFSPFGINLDNEYITIPTGIRWVTDSPNLVLLLFPRSGLGFKYGVHLRNTTGVIDSDYCNADNSGHIMVKIAAQNQCSIGAGKGLIQGIIVPCVFTDIDTHPTAKRIGGFGSTTEVQ